MNIFNIFQRSKTKPTNNRLITLLNVENHTKLKKIEQILFPPLELYSDMDEKGKLIKYHIDYCIDSNLETVLNDLQDGYNDTKCYNTLNSVIKRLIHVRKLLEVETNMDKDAEYILVKDLDMEKNEIDISQERR